MGLTAACDIFLTSETAVFYVPEIDVGPAGAMMHGLFGRSALRRTMYTGLRVPAAEMYRRGVISVDAAEAFARGVRSRRRSLVPKTRPPSLPQPGRRPIEPVHAGRDPGATSMDAIGT